MIMPELVKPDLEPIVARIRERLPGFSLVAGAYLFGSVLDACRPDSDIDVGLVVDPTVPEPAGWGWAGLEAEVEGALGRVQGHPFHVTVLSPHNVLFSFRVVREGSLVYVRDPEIVTDFIEQVARRYPDLAWRHRRALEEVLGL